jgi:cytochrome c oxidase subunit 2
MLFQVKVVSQAAYDTHMAELKSGGNVGQLNNGLNRSPIEKGDQQLLPKGDQ